MQWSHHYDIHDIITISSQAELPELARFRTVTPLRRPTIRVCMGVADHSPRQWRTLNSRGFSRLAYDEIAAGAGLHRFQYDERLGSLGFKAEITMGDPIDVVASPVLKYSPHVLYTNLVEPILRWTFVRKGWALVHGATVSFGDRAYMITAKTDTGKTTTLLLMLNKQRRGTDSAAFISDDLTLVAPDGTVLTYPKPMTISQHTLHAVNSETLPWGLRMVLPFQSRIHSREGRKFALALAQTKLPMATINTLVQFVVPPPKYHVTQLVPNAKLGHRAKLAGLFVIERGGEGEIRLDNKEALETLLSNCDDAYGFPPYHTIKEFLYKREDTDLRQVERSIVTQAFAELPATLVRSTTSDWWRRIPNLVNEGVAQYFAPRPQPALALGAVHS